MKTFLKAICLLALCSTAGAQTPWGNVNQGMSEAELQAALPDVQPLRRAVAGPHGLRGLWSLPHTPVVGVPFDTTFYFRDKRLQQVEQLFVNTQPGCDARASYTALVNELSARYGKQLTANDSAAGSAGMNISSSWVAGDTDVVASIAMSAARCSMRLIYRERAVKDADEL
ncbi:hypothetical protein BH11PSE7_BH11PSE7_29770 [soil metagenome]